MHKESAKRKSSETGNGRGTRLSLTGWTRALRRREHRFASRALELSSAHPTQWETQALQV
jgi:hypothetical protein